MKRVLFSALFLLPVQANAAIGDCAGSNTVPFKTRPYLSAWYERTDHGRFVWCYLKNQDQTKAPDLAYVICKHGICNMQTAWQLLDDAKLAGPIATLPARIDAAVTKVLGPSAPSCGFDFAAFKVNPYTRDAAGNKVVYNDSDFFSACMDAMPFFLADWPAAPNPVPTPDPTPTPNPTPVPPALSFVVAPTSICATQDKNAQGVCITRQSFSWDGSIRGPLAQPERATIGAPCDPTKGPAPYFVFDASRPDRVVQCIKK